MNTLADLAKKYSGKALEMDQLGDRTAQKYYSDAFNAIIRLAGWGTSTEGLDVL